MPNRAVHPRARSIFKARTKKPNFVLSVAATTIRLQKNLIKIDYIIVLICYALCVILLKVFISIVPN